ncbi:hypothetical protein [Mycolicibacterium agri]|uniref:Uncharacterized protein n=1 Tax=Mycolicibacterium agri TaxID=36811 RepID=A0A7I9W2F6_MYCAG|nr:hypothetical protein [Mycolicibacterium agri]GFG51527.1 hypothetical protein MAGR_29680 [Mycolicibacterium agri]
MNSQNRNTAKLAAAVIGGSAMVIMGAVAMTIDQQAVHTGQTDVASVGKMTIPATTTASGKADTVVATSFAVPSIKGPAPLPKEEAAAE